MYGNYYSLITGQLEENWLHYFHVGSDCLENLQEAFARECEWKFLDVYVVCHKFLGNEFYWAGL